MFAEHAMQVPVFSAVLFLIAGALVGYALCQPRKDDSDQVAHELRELHRQNVSLQGTLQSQRESYARLERNYIDQRQEWANLRGTQEKLVTSLQDQNRQPAAGSPESSTRVAEAEAVSDTLRSELREARNELLRVQAEHDTQTQQLQRAEQLAADAHHRLQSVQPDSEARVAAAVAVANGLQAELQEARAELDRVQCEQDARQRRLKDAEQVAAQAQHQLQQLQKDVDTAEATREQLKRLRAAHQSMHQQVRVLTLERDSLSDEKERSTGNVEQLREQLQRTYAAVDKIRSHREELLAELRKSQQERAELAELLVARDQQLATFEQAPSTAFEYTDDEWQAICEERDLARKQLIQAQSREHKLAQTQFDLEAVIDTLTRQLQASQQAVATLRRQCDEFQHTLQRQEAITAGIVVATSVDFSEQWVHDSGHEFSEGLNEFPTLTTADLDPEGIADLPAEVAEQASYVAGTVEPAATDYTALYESRRAKAA